MYCLRHLGLAGANQQEARASLESADGRNHQDKRDRDFGPTLVAEKLAELHDIHLSVESARLFMIAAGYGKPRKGTAISVHPPRERRARLGELVQIDGSPHNWLEGRADRCTLLVFIDDVTGRLLQLRFAPTETTLEYMHTLHDHIVAHVLPVALYSDKHSIFRINAKEADPEATFGAPVEFF